VRKGTKSTHHNNFVTTTTPTKVNRLTPDYKKKMADPRPEAESEPGSNPGRGKL